MDDLLAEFVAEAHDMLDALAGEIVAWENDPTDGARLDVIFRFFHTVKGNCGFFDFPRLEALSHAAEDVLADVRAGRRQPDSALVDACLAIIDRISEMVAAIEAGEEFPEGGDEMLIDALASTPEAETEAEVESDEPALGPQPGTNNSGRAGLKRRSIRLQVELLDRIMSGVSDMVLARNDLARRMQAMGGETGLEAPFNRLGSILDEVRDAITRTRMQPIDTLFSAFPRMVRDLSSELGKQVMVELEDGDVELDRELIEVIRDPLVHVIRNAVDHGIETPVERIKAGKREIGMLTISARQTGNEILIGVIDDGCGIDSERLVDKAIANGFLTADEAARMTPRERNLLICEAGLTTRDKVTSVSGRGVGMDVVRANLEQIGGSISIDTTRGSGTRILLSVPLTLSIVPSLTIGVGAQKFAIPRSYVEEVVHVDANEAEIAQVGDTRLITIREKRVPCVALADVLEIEGASDSGMLVVIRLVGGDLIGISVDQIYDHDELVVKPLSPAVMACGFYVGNTQMDDGSPVLMLDVAGIAREAGLVREVENRRASSVDDEGKKAEKKRKLPVLLFDALDGVRRVVAMNVVTRVEKVELSAIRQAGPLSQVVIDGNVLPLAGVPHGAELGEIVNVLRLTDGISQISYAFGDMVDISSIDADLAPDQSGAETIGIALIEGEPVEVLDCHQLFAGRSQRESGTAKPICRMSGQDRWSQEFLRPLVESVGYRVIDEADDGHADVAIAARESDEVPELRAAKAIWLRANPEATAEDADTIYRYDRDGLMAALETAKLSGKVA